MAELKQKNLAELLQKAQAGDSTALQALCKALEGFIRGYFRQRFQDNSLIDDLCQETYIRLLKNLPQVREEMKLTGFVAKVAFYVMQDHFRQKYRRQEEALETDYERTQTAKLKAEIVDANQDEQILDKLDLDEALQQLSEKSRNILMLKSRGYNYEEIAADVGISVSGVKMQVKRSMEQLRAVLFAIVLLMVCSAILFFL